MPRDLNLTWHGLLNVDSPMSATSSQTRWGVVLTIGCLFVAYSFWTASIPGSNEPHYLCKAKFWWQPEWCAHDLFLESSNPHFVFYVVLGWMTKWLPLEVVAIIGRLSGYFALAAGWEWLCRSLRLTDRASVLAAVLLVAFAAIVNLSGEWLIGGIESKIYAYAGVFAGLAACFERRIITAGCWFGVAIAFHPLVGAWSVVALCVAGVVDLVLRGTLREPSLSTLHVEKTLQSGGSRGTLSVAFVLGSAIAATGLVPAMQSIGGKDPLAATNATFIQVFYRLSHHLHPDQFPLSSYIAYGVLLAVGLMLSRKRIPTFAVTTFRGFVVGAVLIATSGWIAGSGLKPTHFGEPFFNLRMTALKFYPFRLADAVIPAFAAIMLAQALSERTARQPRGWLARRGTLSAVLLVLLAFWVSRGVRAARYIPDEWAADWLEVCHWVHGHTPEQALFVTPRESWAFKWFAERPEYVAFKDCPQDARSLNEWNKRLLWLNKWAERGFLDTTYSRDEVVTLARQTDASFFITRREARMDAPQVFSNATYLVYDLRDLTP